MNELDHELTRMRLLALRVTARKVGMNMSERYAVELLGSGVSLDAAFNRMLQERSLFDRVLGTVRTRFLGWSKVHL